MHETDVATTNWISKLDREFVTVAKKQQLAAGKVRFWRYPWTNLEEQLGKSPLLLIGYGSLMNRASASRTLGDYDSLKPVPGVAFGGERVYEYFMPDEVVERYGVKIKPNERAALNVRETTSASSFFNGVLLTISINLIEPLRERERDYDLIAMPFLPWGADEFLGDTAYCLVARRNSNEAIRSHLIPHPGYHEICLRGAESQTDSTAFREMFLSTTSLWDGTKLRDWKSARLTELSNR